MQKMIISVLYKFLSFIEIPISLCQAPACLSGVSVYCVHCISVLEENTCSNIPILYSYIVTGSVLCKQQVHRPVERRGRKCSLKKDVVL